MKAAVLHEFKHPLVIEEIERPEPGPGDVLIQVEACGVCHSDVHVADGDWRQFAGIVKKPLVPGHEIAGCVVEKGAAVDGLSVGDHVGVPWLHWTCGECDFCRAGFENLCAAQKITGVTVDGGYAEFVRAPASHTERIPEGLSSTEAAPLFCAGVTVYRALKQAQIAPGQRLAVFGIGGLGHLAVQIGIVFGAEVIALDLYEDKLALAKSLGASATLNAAAPGAAKVVRGQGGVHVAIVTSPSRAAYDLAFNCLRPTGTLLAVGLPAENVCFPPIMMAAKEAHIRAIAVGTRQDLRDVLAIAAAGKVRCKVLARPLDAVNDVLEELRRGQVTGRIVLVP
ncbi:MAG TPA: alcohol dehydrogenase catalytic domain-containing protein [Terriglobia bacterium]|nr:alcohol dehydrogenase catalytic domain-containing protein [Terriglobia bacterium]